MKSDLDLLKKADEHPAGCNTYEANALDGMLKQVQSGRPLTVKQRTWVERLIDQLDSRRRRGDVDDSVDFD